MIDFSHRVKRLEVHADGQPSGQLLPASQYRFAYQTAPQCSIHSVPAAEAALRRSRRAWVGLTSSRP